MCLTPSAKTHSANAADRVAVPNCAQVGRCPPRSIGTSGRLGRCPPRENSRAILQSLFYLSESP